jgi:sigma-E factor negative regulatory protein RseA
MNKVAQLSEQNSREWLASLADDALARWPEGRQLDEQDVCLWRDQQFASSALKGEPVCDESSTTQLLAAMQRAYTQADTTSPSLHSSVPVTAQRWWQWAANDAQAAWPWAAAVVLSVGVWVAWPGAGPERVVVAQDQSQPVMSGGVLRDPQLDALLQSHRQWGAGSALQFPAGYVRNVVLER